MASYHLSAQVIGRSSGRSAVAAAAYRAGEKLDRAETGETHDYRRKRGIVSAEILVPDDAPTWTRDRAQLWNSVEAKETRSNSQLAREIRVALPNELDDQAARELVTDWARRNLVASGMVVDLAIHDPEPGPGRERNRHAHLLCTMRELDASAPGGWSKKKQRTWNAVPFLEGLRESWAEAQNLALERAGSAARVDHRSLEEQRSAALDAGDTVTAHALDRDPEPNLGAAVTAIEARAARRARRAGRDYMPVTERARAVSASRSLRARLRVWLDVAREARQTLAAHAVRAVDPFRPARPTDPFRDRSRDRDPGFEM